ncbi:hypothetical protein [Laribacter hongkongensis]|uniref:hypothetical protein n=1 Tax=Laribacter hongkongensis TaxID=168471 RepID=UPI00402B3A1D
MLAIHAGNPLRHLQPALADGHPTRSDGLLQRLQLWQSHRHDLAICRHLLLTWHCAGQQYVADVLQCQRSGQPTLAGVFDAGGTFGFFSCWQR